jgi:hypothetical protein
MMKNHVTVVGILRIGLSALGVILAVLLVLLLVGIGVAVSFSGDDEALPILAAVGLGVGGTIAVLSVPGIVGGIGVLLHKNWARYLVLVLSVIDLINFPLGTIVAIYSIFVLVQDETIELFAPAHISV